MFHISASKFYTIVMFLSNLSTFRPNGEQYHHHKRLQTQARTSYSTFCAIQFRSKIKMLVTNKTIGVSLCLREWTFHPDCEPFFIELFTFIIETFFFGNRLWFRSVSGLRCAAGIGVGCASPAITVTWWLSLNIFFSFSHRKQQQQQKWSQT